VQTPLSYFCHIATSLVCRCIFGRHTTKKCLVIVLPKNDALMRNFLLNPKKGIEVIHTLREG
jgi:hypothetical protein